LDEVKGRLVMFKRVLSIFCAVVLLVAFACSAAAAPSPSPDDYAVRVRDGKIEFVKGQKVKGSYSIQSPARLTLQSDEDGDLLLLFTQPDGRRRNITLRSQKTLSLDGEFSFITLNSSLLSDISVVLEPSSSVEQLSMYSGSQTFLCGKAQNVTVSGSAKLSMEEGAKAGLLRVLSSKAQVNVDRNASVQEAYSAASSSVKGLSSVSGLDEWEDPNSSSDSDSDSDSSSSGGSSGSDPDSQPGEISIVGIVPSMGKVVVELSAPVELDVSNFYIHCPAGKDMTIISASTPSGTQKNRLYTLNTSYYKENTYYLQITLPDGKQLEKKFVVNIQSPELSNFQAERVSVSSAEITFVSDTAGFLYYMAVPQAAARSLIGENAPQDSWELHASGESRPIASGPNTFTIDGLSEGTGYTFYCAAADTAGENLSGLFLPLAVPADPKDDPEESGYSIVSTEQISDYGFTVVLNKPTETPLELSAFYAKCPAQDALTLGRVETDDNQTYRVYLKEYYFFMPKNHYNVEVTFPDGSKASGRFYAETYPAIGIITAERTPDGTLRVSFNSDKPGTVYCITMSEEETKPNVSWMMQNAEAKELVAGSNELTFSGVPEDHARFYLVAIDKKGNAPEFVDEAKIVQVDSLPEQPEETNAITGVTVNNSSGSTTTLELAIKEPIDSIGLEPTVTTISGGGDNPPRIFSTWGNNEMFSTIIYIKLNIVLAPGEYRVNIHPADSVLSYTFEVK
jgi:hypothetical protein